MALIFVTIWMVEVMSRFGNSYKSYWAKSLWLIYLCSCGFVLSFGELFSTSSTPQSWHTNPFREATLYCSYSSCSADTYLSWPKWNHQSWVSSIKSACFIDNMKLFYIQWSCEWLIDLIIFKELSRCNVSRCSPIEACVSTIGRYQSVNNPCHLLPF